MERTTIDTTVRKYLARALDIDPTGIDTSLSMKDVGANSLDIVEVVSSTMRELKVRAPREALDQVKTIDAFVDLLHERAQG